MKNEKKAAEWLGLALVVAMLIGCARMLLPLAYGPRYVDVSDVPSKRPDGYTVVIDAGHGGEDGGAVGFDGVLEKDLNLKVSMMLCDMLSSAGVRAVMTRSDDRLLYTEEQNVFGHRKENDLKNRLVISEKYENGILVSIHMNRFPQESCRGMQVYYSANDVGSRALAASIQDGVRDSLQTYNTRSIKPADSSIYLLSRSQNPAVLVECGFLSNREECEKLSCEDYQRRLSFVIFCGIIEYISSNDDSGG